jgi:hypothetical protein
MTPWCPYEADVTAAVLERRRLTDDGDELMTHAAGCEICREVLMVTRLLVDDREQARREIHVPAAGQVWWRAAVRARLEAVHAAARPLTWLNGIAGACAIGLVIALASVAWPFARAGAEWLVAIAFTDSSFSQAVALVMGTLQRGVVVMLLAATCLVFAPLALYLALSDD